MSEQSFVKNNSNMNAELAAIEVLRQTGIDVLEAALIAKFALEAGRGHVKHTLECIYAGAEALKMRKKR